MKATISSKFKLTTEEDQLKDFNKLSWSQKNNAIAFGKLSDYHIKLIRTVIREEAHFKKHGKVDKMCYFDIMGASGYTGSEPLGSISEGSLKEKDYYKWYNKEERVNRGNE